MRKIISKIAGLMLGLSLAAGVGVSLGNVESTNELKAVDYNTPTSYSLANNVPSGLTASVALTKDSNGRGMGKGGTDYTLTTSTSFTGVGKVVVNAATNYSSYSSHSISVTVGGNSFASSKNFTAKASTDYTFEASSASGVVVVSFDNSADGTTKSNTIWCLTVSVYTIATASYTVNYYPGTGASGTIPSSTGASISLKSWDDISGVVTAPSGKAFSGWNTAADGSGTAYTAGQAVAANLNLYAQWANAYTVTYTAGTNGSGSFEHELQPSGTYTLLPFTSLTGVSASTGYRFKDYTVGGVNKNPGQTVSISGATAVTVNFEAKPEDTTYDFASNFSTYASSWTTTYGSKTLAGTTDVGGDYAATIVLGRANKQSGGTIPTLAAQKDTTCENIIVFTLTETGKKIKDVTVTFTKRSSNTPTVNLFKGSDTTASGITSIDSATIGTKSTLSASNLNDVSFSVNCVAAGSSNNCSVDLVSIYVSVENQAAYGTTNHIKVTSFPNTVYHIGENYDPTGLVVTAYDGADEGTANFKDVTADVTTRFGSQYVFDDDDVPTTNMWVEYEDENNSHFYAEDIVMHVYALAEYQLVESEPASWAGNYLIVATNSDSELRAMNGALTQLDVEGNHKAASEKSTGIIENGQELEFVIAPYSTGYSIQGKSGKYIGWASGSGNGLTASDTALVNTLSYDGSGVAIAGSGGRKLAFNNDGEGRFRYYTSGTVQLYKLVESDNADAYAQTFLGAFTCDSTGENAPTFTIKEGSTYWTWSLLAEEYNTLSAAEKEQFRLGVPSKTGTNIEQALARYDLVVGKYGWDNFMSRVITSGAPMVQPVTNSSSSTIVIVVVALTSISSIGVLLVIKRKRSLVK